MLQPNGEGINMSQESDTYCDVGSVATEMLGMNTEELLAFYDPANPLYENSVDINSICGTAEQQIHQQHQQPLQQHHQQQPEHQQQQQQQLHHHQHPIQQQQQQQQHHNNMQQQQLPPQHLQIIQPEYLTKQEPQQPNASHWSNFPNLTPVNSSYNFEMNVGHGQSDQVNWLFNAQLDKIYIKLNSVMNFTFSYIPIEGDVPIFLRAMLLFNTPELMHQAVERCPNHRAPLRSSAASSAVANHSNNNSNDGFGTEPPQFHILKCCHPRTQYQGIEGQQLFGTRASLIIPLVHCRPNEYGLCTETIGFEFLCQNSCSNGIQRKNTVVVFTLENENRELLGKQLIAFKVCSAPKRDMTKDLKSLQHVVVTKRGSSALSSGTAGSVAGGGGVGNGGDGTPSDGKYPTKLRRVSNKNSNDSGAAIDTAQQQQPQQECEQKQQQQQQSQQLPPPSPAITRPFVKIEPNILTPPPLVNSPQIESSSSSSSSSSSQPTSASPNSDGYPVTILMPTKESALHVYRCAYNEMCRQKIDGPSSFKQNDQMINVKRHIEILSESLDHK